MAEAAGLHRGPGVLRRRWPLFALCAGLALAEAIVLRVTGFRSALPLAPQVSAPVSFGVYHDLRWLFPYNWSWASAAWQLAALLAFRTLVTVAIVLLAWPADTDRPGAAPLLRRNLVATLIAVVALSPWVTVAFAAQVVAFSWLLILSIVASFVTVLVLPLAVTGRWWRRLLLWRIAGWVTVAWVALTIEALVISLSPSWVAVLAALGGGLVNALIWLGLVHSVVHAPEPKRDRPLAPVAIVAVLALFLVAGGFAVTAAAPGQQQVADREPVPGGRPALYVAGFGTKYNGEPFTLFSSARVDTWHYSYRGLGPDGPLAYDPFWTRQAVGVSAAKLAEQIQWLADKTGQQVAVIASSEGTLVARAYFATHPDPPVDYFVMNSPLPRPGRVYYPPPGETGWGFLGGWELRGLLQLLAVENPRFTIDADMPFVRSVAENAGVFRPTVLCPVGGGVSTFALLPFAGATVLYHGKVSHVPWAALPGWHTTLLARDSVAQKLVRLLTTGRFTFDDASTSMFRVIWGAAAAWQVPALPLHLRAGWDAPPHTDPAFAEWRCYSP